MGLAKGFGAAILLVSCGLQYLVCGVPGFWDDSSVLHCGLTSLQFTLPSWGEAAALDLTALDIKGTSHYIHNSSACGTWVGQKTDGSMIINSAYEGCYVREKDGEYVMTIGLKETLLNGKVNHHKKELKCPVLAAMDAPSPDVCAAIQRGDRVSCAAPPVSRDLCEGLGCCFSPTDANMQCYYGNKVTAQCTADNQVVVAISKDAAVPPLILDSVNVISVDTATCNDLRVTKSNSFAVFQFPLFCGRAQMTDIEIVYENQFEATRDVRNWQGASITRDSTMTLTVLCSYSRTSSIPLQVEVVTLPPPSPVSTIGPLSLEMRIAQDPSYAAYYAEVDYPVVKVLREPVYLEVRILRRTDPNLVLVLNDCWATQSTDASQQPQWPIIAQGCEFFGDNYLTELISTGASQSIPFPAYYQRFTISTFTFVDSGTQLPLGGLVYFHCSASVCVPSAFDSCRVTCATRKKRTAKKSVKEQLTTIVTSGPVEFPFEMEKFSIEGSHDSESTYKLWAKGTAAAGGVMTVLVIVSVWIYHKRSPHMYNVKV
ncbi:zona pellucida sperm-binding protein 4 [Bombina bombina]|uniref:zona pellucida sperm-binding protein 4 n=1 Tax=Bombina bombina TaxID=8345 RepID=UPI00235ACA4E|nr:zona pellucida sperm-binding protein 4 [Bombina bombina]